jgi:hypothetical protein
MAHAHIQRLKKRLEASEAAAEELREGFAKAVESGTLHPAAAGAELIAAAIRGGNADPYRKALKTVNHETPDEAMRKQRDRRDKDGLPEREVELEVSCGNDDHSACDDLLGQVEGVIFDLGAPFIPQKHEGVIYIRPPVS